MKKWWEFLWLRIDFNLMYWKWVVLDGKESADQQWEEFKLSMGRGMKRELGEP